MALLWLLYRRRQEFDGVLDGLLYGALVGFGFAMTENFFYFIGAFDEGGYAKLSVIIFLRSILFGLNHAFYTGLMGVCFGFARNALTHSRRVGWIVLGFAVAMLTHGLHNFGAGITSVNAAGLLLSLLVAAGGFGAVLLAILLSWQQERRCIQRELADEVGVLLTPEELALLTGRWRQPVNRRKRKDLETQRMQLYVELALRKNRLHRLGASHEPELPQQITDLRSRLAPGSPQAV